MSNVASLRLEARADSAVGRLTEIAAALSEEFAATAGNLDAQAAFPFDNLARVADAGLTGLVTPRRFGGLEAGVADAVRIVRILGRGEPSTALVVAQQYLFHGNLRGNPRWPDGMREKVSRSAVAGGYANMFRVEPELGTPVRGGLPATTARKVEGGWLLSGHKIFSTGSPILEWNGIWAKTDEPSQRVGTFLVPRDTPGFTIEETWDHLGLRASGSHDVWLRDVFVPDDHAVDVRRTEEWSAPDVKASAWVALLFAAVYDGVAQAARDWLVTFLKTRVPANLGAPLATLPRMQEVLGRIDMLLLQNDRLFALSDDIDRGAAPPAHQIYLAKTAIDANSIAAVQHAVEVSGNPALTRRNPLERHLRDVLCARVHSPQTDSALIGAGRAALGL
jgi:alkylation response protein AidB-like acyl-CoA dehydrogenase